MSRFPIPPLAVAATALALALAACGEKAVEQAAAPTPEEIAVAASSGPAAVDAKRLLAAEDDPANWMSYGRTYAEQRFSQLEQVNDDSVTGLGLAWSFDFDTRRGIEATSLVVDGVMYTTSSWSIVHALDARTGEHLWTYDPEVNREKIRHGCCDAVNRGVAVWEGQVFVGVFDGRLVALDAATGKVNWEVATVDTELPYTITGAPRVIDGKVLIGNGGAEYGVRGFISAYDATTGDMVWRFYTVPGNPELGFESDAMKMAADTWNGSWWELGGGGGTVWDAMAYDHELNLLYIGVGNGAPWNREIRSPGGGDNLFLSSIVALRPDTGEYVWHYQTTPGDNWDYTATQPLMLADLQIDGELRQVIMQAPKNGFFYVVDRVTGEFISGQAFAEVTWATGLTPEGRPIENPVARALEGGVHVAPGPNGSHNWHPMSFNPETGLVYFPVYEHSMLHAVDETWEYDAGTYNIAGDFQYEGPETGSEMAMRGRLVAWDPVTQQEAWRVEHPQPLSGGTLSTASGLVFQGRADGRLRAYRAADGEVLWEFEQETGIAAAPMTYEVDGTQYLAVLAGWGGPEVLINAGLGEGKTGPGRLLVFRLDGDAELPPPVPPLPPIEAPTFELGATPAELTSGETLYSDNCVGCHGLDVISGGITPDLRRTTADVHGQFQDIVLGAIRAPLGMPGFSDRLGPEEVRSIQAYVLQRARDSAGGY